MPRDSISTVRANPTVPLATGCAALAFLAITAGLFAHDPTMLDEPMTTSSWLLTAATLLLQAGALAGRDRWPFRSMLIVSALPLALAALAPNSAFTVTIIPVTASVFLAGLHFTLTRTIRWSIAVVTCVALGQLINRLGLGDDEVLQTVVTALAQALVVVIGPLLPACVLSSHRAATSAQREMLNALAREREAQISEAIAHERSTMARELHDIAAHHLSGISLMAASIARQCESHPEAAKDGALEIRQQSRAVLHDLRQLVGLLREDDDQQIKTLASIERLVDTANRNGRRVDLTVLPDGERDPGRLLSPLAQLAGYRMVQESLTNVGRHAPGADSTVIVDAGDSDALHLTVRNTSPTQRHDSGAGGSGLGILGMSERAALVGGSLDFGPTDDNGWVTHMRIPFDPDRGNR
ncbi:sensor histidine kinase [Brevibacterium sediminis]|uniref:histidine kinase n=1 Tax=Brevibacterium sediminis TaxID=1857024 RepID=A0A5C4WUN6_9MICO|nr:histidine kinase [Brevibacterium sediminis]TNM51583.1 sensor histidine kinase [Brevibacterium sediminis]